MKHLELNIKCCKDCPYLHHDPETMGGFYWYCAHDSFDESKLISKKRQLDDFDIDDEVHLGCPLSDKPDVLSIHHIRANGIRCINCGGDHIILTDSDRYPLLCLNCRQQFGDNASCKVVVT